MGFSKAEAVKFGFKKVKEDPFITLGISLAAAIYWTVPIYIIRYVLRINELMGSLMIIFFLVLSLLILMGYSKAGIDIHDGNSVSLKDLFMHYKKLPDFLIGLLFYLVLIAISSIFLIIPGIFIAVRFSFGLFFVLQGDGPALDSLKKSWNVTSGHFFNLLIFYLLLFALFFSFNNHLSSNSFNISLYIFKGLKFFSILYVFGYK